MKQFIRKDDTGIKTHDETIGDLFKKICFGCE